MHYKTVNISRKELYEMAWSEPLSKLSSRLEVSDRGLAKICQRMNIPVPTRGYWAKKQAGHPLEQLPLPPSIKGQQETVTFSLHGKPEFDQDQENEALRRIDEEKLPENRILVPSSLVSPHTHIVRTEKTLKSNAKIEKGRLIPKTKNALNIKVGPNSVDRALRIMDSLIKGLINRGHKVVINNEKRLDTQVHILGESISIGLEEKVRRTENTTKEKVAYWDGDEVEIDRREFIYTPTGNLTLQYMGIGGMAFHDGRKPIEDRLNHFVEKLYRAAVYERATRNKREREKREWQERERRRQKEEDNHRILTEGFAAWQKAEQIERYANWVRYTIEHQHGEIRSGSELDLWLAWVGAESARLFNKALQSHLTSMRQ